MKLIHKIPVFIVLSILLQESIDQLIFNGNWNLALIPRQDIWRIFTAPFSHGNFSHAISNILVFFPLSYLVINKNIISYIFIWIGYFIFEIAIWLFSVNSMHGLSGIVYSLLGYLIFIGFLEGQILSILYSILIILVYGNLLYSLLPMFSGQEISWLGHFSGFINGILIALLSM